MLYDAEVVTDEEVRQVELLAEFLHQVEYLRLDGDVEGGDRFVRDHQSWVHNECASNADSLPLPPAKRMGVSPYDLWRKSYPADHLRDAILAFPCASESVHPQRVTDDVVDGHAGIQG